MKRLMLALLLRLTVRVLNRLTGPQLAQVQAALFRPDPEGAARFEQEWNALTARTASSTA